MLQSWQFNAITTYVAASPRVYPRPHFWFQHLVVNLYKYHLCHEHFRVNIQRVWRNSKTAKELGSALQFRQRCLQAYKVLFRKNHEASAWKIILPIFLAGICHYPRCDWLRYLSGQVKPSCEVV